MCSKAFGGSRTEPNLEKLIKDNQNFTNYLPDKSNEYIEKIINLSFLVNEPYGTELKIKDEFKERTERIIKKIKAIEKDNMPKEEEIFEASRYAYFANRWRP